MGTELNIGIRVGIGSDVTVGANAAVGVGVSVDKRVAIGVAVGVAPPQPRIITRRNNMVMKAHGLKRRRNRFTPFRLRSGQALPCPSGAHHSACSI